MHAANREANYTAGVWAKVRPEMLRAMTEAAEAEGLKLPEWLRKVIGMALNGDTGQRILLAEVMALRTALLTLAKEKWRGAKFTDAELREMVDACDARKFAMADARILTGKSE
jgi:hypothetical protein